MIRTGRPAFHIKAHSISFITPDGDIEYYELDQKGDLVRSLQNKKIVLHHVVKAPLLQTNQNQLLNTAFFQGSNLINQYQQVQFQNQPHQYLSFNYQYQQPKNQQQNEAQKENHFQHPKEKNSELSFNLNVEGVEEDATLFEFDPNNDLGFSFFDIDNEITDWI